MGKELRYASCHAFYRISITGSLKDLPESPTVSPIYIQFEMRMLYTAVAIPGSYSSRDTVNEHRLQDYS